MAYDESQKPTDAPVFSYSQLGTADCLRKWRYAYLDRRRLGSSPAMQKGSCIHEYMDFLYSFFIKTGGRSRELNNEEFEEVFSKETSETFAVEVKVPSISLVRQYVDVAPALDKNYVILASEQRQYVPYILPSGRKIYFEIVIDVVLMDTRTGHLVIMDHKSSAQPWKQEQAEIDAQLPLYMACQKLLDRPVGVAIINNIVTSTRKDKAAASLRPGIFGRYKIVKTSRALDTFLLNLGYRIDTILDAKERNIFPMILNKGCATCSYRPVCSTELDHGPTVANKLLEGYLSRNEVSPQNVITLKPVDKPVKIDYNDWTL